MLPTIEGWSVQWKPPLVTACGVLEPPGVRVPKSTDPLSITIRCVVASAFRKLSLFPPATCTGFGEYAPLPALPTIDTVTVLAAGPGGVGAVGAGGVVPPP
jgi:hypothetical protein